MVGLILILGGAMFLVYGVYCIAEGIKDLLGK